MHVVFYVFQNYLEAEYDEPELGRRRDRLPSSEEYLVCRRTCVLVRYELGYIRPPGKRLPARRCDMIKGMSPQLSLQGS